MHRFFLPGGCREFFLMIDQCDREVELLTREGFHLNLKSKLCQYVALTSIFCNKKVKECELVTHSGKDTERILKFLIEDKSSHGR